MLVNKMNVHDHVNSIGSNETINGYRVKNTFKCLQAQCLNKCGIGSISQQVQKLWCNINFF